MDLNRLITKAVENNEVEKLLRGEGSYGIPVTEFTSEVLPTEIDYVLVGCFYEQFGKMKSIDMVFDNALNNLINGSASDVYVAFLYFGACIFEEEEKKATFMIDRKRISKELRKKLYEHEMILRDSIEFCNGEKKENPWNYIISFNEFCKKKYGFALI